MTTQTVTLDLPELLYQKLRLPAAQSQRTVEDELLEVLATAVPVTDDLPAELSAAITPLATLNDADLWRAAQTQLPSNVATRLEELHLKRQREGLTGQQEHAAAALIRQYERYSSVPRPQLSSNSAGMTLQDCSPPHEQSIHRQGDPRTRHNQARHRCGYCLTQERVVGTRWRSITSFPRRSVDSQGTRWDPDPQTRYASSTRLGVVEFSKGCRRTERACTAAARRT